MNVRSRGIHVTVARRTSQNVRKQYFQTKQARKTQNVWRNVVRRLRCFCNCRLSSLLLTRGVAPRDLHLWLTHGTSQNAIFSNKKKKTRKRAIAKALQLEGHSDFAAVDLAYYQHFLFFFVRKYSVLGSSAWQPQMQVT